MERTIEATTKLTAAPDRAMRVLRLRPLAVDARHGIDVEMGPADDLGNAVLRPVLLHGHHRAHLFPTLDGDLTVELDDDGGALLRLRGTYTVPLGPAGTVGDDLGGWAVARHTLQALVDDLARAIDAAAEPLEPHDEVPHHAVTVRRRARRFLVG